VAGIIWKGNPGHGVLHIESLNDGWRFLYLDVCRLDVFQVCVTLEEDVWVEVFLIGKIINSSLEFEISGRGQAVISL
jgi:hypothetical protein